MMSGSNNSIYEISACILFTLLPSDWHHLQHAPVQLLFPAQMILISNYAGD